MFDIFFYLFSALIIILTLGAGFAFLKYSQKRKQILQSLNFILYEITLPHEKPQESEKKFQEMISAMEQFYNGMSALKNYFILEIGLPTVGREVVFYCAVDKNERQIFEKQIQGLFPHANISVKMEDYNIFKPEGFSAGSFARLKKDEVLPLKTYDKFEVDPLQVIINTFSKLQAEGEGAALQIIISPSKKKIVEKAKMVIAEIRKGESFSGALKSHDSFGKRVWEETAGFFSGSSDTERKKTELKERPVDEELVKLIESKASGHIMETNIRLLASSNKKERANSILSELESAFLQFSEPQGNNLVFIRPKGKKLKDLFYQFSFRVPNQDTITLLSTAELSTVFHLPMGLSAISAPQLKYLKTKESPPPLNLPQTGILLGKNIYRGETTDVLMKEDDRRRHFYIIGQTGTGKSVLLKNMIVQDIEEGRGVCFIDPHGQDLQDILSRIPTHRLEDLIYFNPADTARPMGLNMLEYDQNYPEQKIFIVNELLGIFNKLFDMKVAGGPMFEQYFRNSAMLVMDDPPSGNTLLEIGRVLAEKNFREYKLSRCKNPVVRNFWKEVAEKAGGEASLQNMVPYITSKFDTFLSNDIMRPIIAQEKSAFNFRQAMDEGKIILVNLSKGRLGDINSNLIGLIIVGKLLMSSLSRIDIPEERRKDFYLYIDEFQNTTTDSIATILSEARKYKLNLTMAHQFIGQLEDNIKKAVFGNVGSMASFRVGAEDAEFLEKQFEPVFNTYDLINIDNYNAFVKLLIDGYTSRPFNIQTLPFRKRNPEVAEEMIRLSSLKYGRPREEIEEEINKKYER